MEITDGWDVALLVVAGYMAAKALVGLMLRRRDQMLEAFRQDLDAERERRKEAARRAARYGLPPDSANRDAA